MAQPRLTESAIRAIADAESFRRGRDYYRGGAISDTAIQGNVLTGLCEGQSAPFYQVRVELDKAGVRAADCTCPYDYGGSCKHVVALLLTYLHHPKQFAARAEPAELLADLDRDALATLLTSLLQKQPELYDWVAAAVAAPAAPGAKQKKTKRKKVDIEVYRRQVRSIVHSLDYMRPSEAYWHVGSLVAGLSEMQATAMKFLDAGDAETALQIFLALLEDGAQAIEFIDDSNGELGGFFGDIGLPLAEVILSLERSAVERTQLAEKLSGAADYLSDYGMDETIDVAIQAAAQGWEDGPPYRRTRKPRVPIIGYRLDNAGFVEEYEAHEDWRDAPDEYWDAPASGFADLVEAKLNVLDRQGRTEEYLALAKNEERHARYAVKLSEVGRVEEAVSHAKKHLGTADEALLLAESLRDGGHIAAAAAIGERGLKLDGPKAHLGKWLGPLHEAQGQTKKALAAWQIAFAEDPELDTYQTLQRLAGAGWKRLRPAVMAALRKSRDDQTLAEVLLYEQAWDEAIKVAEKRDAWYPIIEMVADTVLPHRPEWVARAGRKHAERLMVEAKSKNYPIAADWLRRAKKAYAALGRQAEFKKYLEEVKDKYRRRPALQAQLRSL